MKFCRKKKTYLTLIQHCQVLFDHGRFFQNTYKQIKDINLSWNTRSPRSSPATSFCDFLFYLWCIKRLISIRLPFRNSPECAKAAGKIAEGYYKNTLQWFLKLKLKYLYNYIFQFVYYIYMYIHTYICVYIYWCMYIYIYVYMALYPFYRCRNWALEGVSNWSKATQHTGSHW